MLNIERTIGGLALLKAPLKDSPEALEVLESARMHLRAYEWEKEARQLTLNEFIAILQPCWIEHRTLGTFCGWAMYHSEQFPMIKIDYVGSGRVMFAPEKYGADWIAFSRKPTKEELEGVWKG